MNNTQKHSTQQSPLWGFGGFYNLKIAFRNLRRNGLYSFINIVGLAVSLAVCTFIIIWVQDEKSYDRFHQNPEEIYLTVTHFKSDGGNTTHSISAGLFAVTAEQNYEEVLSYCRILEARTGFLQVGSIKTDAKPLIYADSTFFSFFNFPVLRGQTKDLLQHPNDVIITERLAQELFGNDEPIGKIISLNGEKNLHVVAVMKDLPHNTSLPDFEMVCSHGLMKERDDWMAEFFTSVLNGWNGNEYMSYLRIKPGTDVAALAKAVTARQTHMQDMRWFTLQPLTNLHLYNLDGEPESIRTVQLFQWIAIIILCIACVNYVNLVTARSSKRRQEIGLRKIMGAGRGQLFYQLMLDACVLFFIAALAAVALNTLLLPAYNELSGKTLDLQLAGSNSWKIYGVMLAFTIVVAGGYPAWLLASYNPLKIIQKKGSGFVRKALVVLQFIASVSLIVGTITMEAQMNYIQHKNLGYNKEQVLTCPSYKMQIATIRPILLQNPAIAGVTGSGGNIMSLQSGTASRSWEGKMGDGVVMLTQVRVDSAFLNVMEIPIVAGSNFTNPAEPEIILNRSAVNAMGLENPIGKRMEAGIQGKIVGVVSDFNFRSLHETISPLILFVGNTSTLYVRIKAGGAKQAIADLEKLWKEYNPDYTFNYSFLDETFTQTYRSDIRTSRLFAIFAIIAILISCLGLFGLVTYSAETKTKEIGIRKVLGASVPQIVKMLSKEFLLLIGIAVFIAFPLTYFWLDKLLKNYAYRISISVWIFILAALAILFITLLTVSVKAFKAASANPVKSIKTE